MYLDHNVSFPSPRSVQFAVFLHHHDLSFLLHLLHVLLHLIENAAIVLLCYTHKLPKTGQLATYSSYYRTVKVEFIHWNLCINVLKANLTEHRNKKDVQYSSQITIPTDE